MAEIDERGKIEKPNPIQNKIQAYMILLEIGEKKLAEQVFKEISKKINFVERDDWINHQICGDFPKIDIRCMAFCCSPAKNCPYRNSVLKKLGKGITDFIEYKERFGEKIKKDFKDG